MATTALSTERATLIEFATLDLLRYDPQAGFELMQQGTYIGCDLAGVLQHEHDGKVFELEPDATSGAGLAWVRVTEYGLNLIGRKSRAQILASEPGETCNDLIVALRPVEQQGI